ncbi:MAG: hypothetical protein OXE40_05485 [Gammaproteobacteria bacterium]|nr:hypothetical protein [Gammaproteobacteria bacterium]
MTPLTDARFRFPGTSLQHLDVAIHEPNFTDLARGKLDDPVG